MPPVASWLFKDSCAGKKKVLIWDTSCIPLAGPAKPYPLICLDLGDFLTLYFEEWDWCLTDLTDKNKDERAAFRHGPGTISRDKQKGIELEIKR